MEYDEQQVIEFMRLYKQVIDNVAILDYCNDLSLRNRAAKQLMWTLPECEKKIPFSIKCKLTHLDAGTINALEGICKEILHKK